MLYSKASSCLLDPSLDLSTSIFKSQAKVQEQKWVVGAGETSQPVKGEKVKEESRRNICGHTEDKSREKATIRDPGRWSKFWQQALTKAIFCFCFVFKAFFSCAKARVHFWKAQPGPSYPHVQGNHNTRQVIKNRDSFFYSFNEKLMKMLTMYQRAYLQLKYCFFLEDV